ncbi:MAG: His/Gly/Thr/Pro-type tRNA ligase C-terminal domain-containing protein, partial [Kofleriaceae bacterium]
NAYAETVRERLEAKGVRVVCDTSNWTMQAKIRDASLQKIPYTIVVGEKEAAADHVTVRTFGNEKAKADTMTFDAFADRLATESRFP